MGRKLPRNGSNELTNSLLLTAWLATVAPATSDRPSILSDSSLLSPLATVNYFAFGSNLNLDLLQRRSTGVNAPVAHVLGSAVAEEDPVVAEPAVVYHHRLAFNIRVLPPFEPAVAAIEPVAGMRPSVAGNRRDRVAGTRSAVAGSESAAAQSRAAVAEAGSAVARNGAAVAGMEVGGELACGELACGELACGELACGELACGELACGSAFPSSPPPFFLLQIALLCSLPTPGRNPLLQPSEPIPTAPRSSPLARSFHPLSAVSPLYPPSAPLIPFPSLQQSLTLRANPNSPSFLPSRKELPL
ncbi:unnamed protein product [Closterium sp. Naga37s-1]|nr:unnamed protein product [Closterium sp. Naga37s-1]